MGDMGVATSVDTYSQFWNPSKYVFSETKSGFGLSYTPYLSKLVNDISLGNLTYFNRINERSAFAVSLRCLLYTSPSPRDLSTSRMPSSA